MWVYWSLVMRVSDDLFSVVPTDLDEGWILCIESMDGSSANGNVSWDVTCVGGFTKSTGEQKRPEKTRPDQNHNPQSGSWQKVRMEYNEMKLQNFPESLIDTYYMPCLRKFLRI